MPWLAVQELPPAHVALLPARAALLPLLALLLVHVALLLLVVMPCCCSCSRLRYLLLAQLLYCCATCAARLLLLASVCCLQAFAARDLLTSCRWSRPACELLLAVCLRATARFAAGALLMLAMLASCCSLAACLRAVARNLLASCCSRPAAAHLRPDAARLLEMLRPC